MTDLEIIERLSDFMGWASYRRKLRNGKETVAVHNDAWKKQLWRLWNPLEKWEDTMELVEKARDEWTIGIHIIGHGYDEKESQVSLYTWDSSKRPKNLLCAGCNINHPHRASKDRDVKRAICEAIISAIEKP
jgi:hypothetical protein